MTLIPRGRVFITAVAFVLAALAGAAGGYLQGRTHTVLLTEARLAKNSVKLEGLLDSFLKESGSLLDTLNSSQFPPCSAAEQAWMRRLIYHAAYIRDLGRMKNGTIQCSADFGTSGLPLTSLRPTAALRQQVNVYANPPFYATGNFSVYLMQKGDAYVVEDPKFEQYWQQIYNSYDIYLPMGQDATWTRPNGKSSHLGGAVVNRDGEGMVGNTIYATRCSSSFGSCTVTYASFPLEMYNNRTLVRLFTSIGALSGLLLVALYLFFYQRSHSIDSQLRRDIRRDKLRVVYQPIVDLATRRIVEAEALLRWTDAAGAAVSPDVFVHIAETSGFVGELTDLVVRLALRDFAETLRANPAFRLNINVTASDLADPRFLPMLAGRLAIASVEPQSLAIEVTESSTARRQEAIDTIRELRRRGHCVQLDDFGTGYSSLAYLKDLAVDAIKIDKTFTHTIGTHAVIGDILPQILAMAESLDLMVIAEGIETPEQADYFAARTRPVLGQGWLFGRPVPAAMLQAQLADQADSAREETLAASA
jgi:sensor c-di-GMP phosphodiesterase-like protein